MTIPLWSIQIATNTYLDLNTPKGITIIDVFGAGMPPIQNVYNPHGIADGASWQRQTVRERAVQIVMSASGASTTGLENLRAELIQAVSPHRSQPLRLWYCRDESTGKYLDCYYEAGLEGGEVKGFTEQSIGLRLLATDPYWRAKTDTTAAPACRQTISNVNRIAYRDAAGVWSSLGGGASGWVNALVFDTGGSLYAGGQFNTMGGVTAIRIAKWDGAAWNTLAGGVAGAVKIVNALAIGPNGALYAGGAFSTAGSIAAANVAKWNGSTWNTLGAGVAAAVYALAIAPDGALYTGGTFHTAGGATAMHIAKWNGSVWGTLGAGVSGAVNAIAIDPDGNVYAGGDFGTAGGGAAMNVAKWNGSAWSALGSGLGVAGNAVNALAIGLDGILYAGGTFSTAGSDTVPYIAQWNGTAWSPLGPGLDSWVGALAIAPDGSLYAGGDFDAEANRPGLGGGAGKIGRPLVSQYAHWARGLWLDGDGGRSTVPEYISALAFNGEALAIGGGFSGNWYAAGHATINNPGSANAYPTITITGPGYLNRLVNYTTDQRIDFDITLLAGETVTLSLTPGAKSFTSSFRGNVISKILPSDFMSWHLAPGNNEINVFVDNLNAASTYTFRAPYWSIDGVP